MGFAALQYVVSHFPDQGSNLRPLHCKVGSEPVDHRGRPIFSFFLNNILVWNNFRFTGGCKDGTDSCCMDFPSGVSGKEPTCQCRGPGRHGSSSWVGAIPWRRAWQPTPVFLPGESHGQRSLAGGSPWGHTESDTTEAMTHVACSVLRL